MPNTYQRSILVTGGTSGMGYQAALQLARQHPDLTIILSARSDPTSSADTINKSLGQSNVQFMPLDLSDLSKVRSFAAEWEKKQLPPIASLVMNAGLQFPGKVEYSQDGFEKTFAIAHIGHALLFFLLRPHLANTARIVIVSSGTHDPAQKSGLPDATYNSAEEMAHPTPETAKAEGRQRYSSSKLTNVMFTYALHRRLQAINQRHGKNWTVTAMDPGLMPGTGLARDAGVAVNFVFTRILPKMIPLLRIVYNANVHTPEESGKALAQLATGDEFKGKSGLYFEGTRAIKSNTTSYDEAKQEDLWQWSVRNLAKDAGEQRAFNLEDLQ
jgi:NAD(P)-dependent dehydrogenase (short-subunit alcohol dehydrogenase family)